MQTILKDIKPTAGSEAAAPDVFINEYATKAWPWIGCPVLVQLSDGSIRRATHTGGSWRVHGRPKVREGFDNQPWIDKELHVKGWKLDPERPAHPDTVAVYLRGHARHMYQLQQEQEDSAH